jgi:hypothetical protein
MAHSFSPAHTIPDSLQSWASLATHSSASLVSDQPRLAHPVSSYRPEPVDFLQVFQTLPKMYLVYFAANLICSTAVFLAPLFLILKRNLYGKTLRSGR